jgi:hypothetical protein
MTANDKKIIEKQRELINALSLMIDWDNYPKDRLDEFYELQSELLELEKTSLEKKCHSIYGKGKEAWTPDKRTFEEAESEPAEEIPTTIREILWRYVTNKQDFSNQSIPFEMAEDIEKDILQEIQFSQPKGEIKSADVHAFSDRLDEIFEQGYPTKAQIIDAFNQFASQQVSLPDDMLMRSVIVTIISRQPKTRVGRQTATDQIIEWFKSQSSSQRAIVFPEMEEILVYFNLHSVIMKVDPIKMPAMTRSEVLKFWEWVIDRTKELNK